MFSQAAGTSSIRSDFRVIKLFGNSKTKLIRNMINIYATMTRLNLFICKSEVAS